MANTAFCTTLGALFLSGAAWLLPASPALAQRASASLKPGEYVTEGAWGKLSLRPGNGRSMLFAIEATGGNLNVCSLDGEVIGGKATLEGVDDKTPCIVTFSATGEGVSVTSSESSACSDYCGAGAFFEGLYLLPSARCASPAVATARQSFKQLYDVRKYAEARAKLEPVLTLCSRTLPRTDEGRIRNDLAVTMHKLNDLSGCLLVLQPLLHEPKFVEAELRQNYAPAEAELMAPIMRAVRTNLKLCGGK